MAWRPTQYLVEGELDNSYPGKVTGWMKFAGLKEKVTFDLEGNFHRDIRGAKIRFKGDDSEDDLDAVGYMQGFAQHQMGEAGDITAGRQPADYVDYPYIEWYSSENGRVVIELEPVQIEVIGTPIPAIESNPISRDEQNRNMAEFLAGLADAANIPAENAVCLGGGTVVKANQKTTSNKIRGMKLLTQEIKKKLPKLGETSEQADSVALVKFFDPTGSWTWFVVEGEEQEDGDWLFYGLVHGFEKEFGYFRLSELEHCKDGQTGLKALPIERDLYFQPTPVSRLN